MKPNRKLTKVLLTAILAIPPLVPNSLLADEKPPRESATVPDGRFVPVQRFQFTNDDIEGGVTGPDGELLVHVSRAKHSSLIELREHFLTEMMKTLEDI
jgi:hypothetical protein